MFGVPGGAGGGVGDWDGGGRGTGTSLVDVAKGASKSLPLADAILQVYMLLMS